MSARFKPDRQGIGEMLCSSDMEAAMLVFAYKVLARAEETAPVYLEGPHPGRYKESFEVSSGVQHRKTSRAYGRVTNVAPEAVFVEYGTVHNERHRTLGKALDAVRA